MTVSTVANTINKTKNNSNFAFVGRRKDGHQVGQQLFAGTGITTVSLMEPVCRAKRGCSLSLPSDYML